MNHPGKLIRAFEQLHEMTVHSQEEVVAFLRNAVPEADTMLIHWAVDFTHDRGLLDKRANLYSRRRPVTDSLVREFEEIVLGGGVDETNPTHIAFILHTLPGFEARIQALETQVGALQATRTTAVSTIHWLTLHEARMPRPVWEALHKRATDILGTGAADSAISTQMVLTAAQLLQEALRSTTGIIRSEVHDVR